MKTKIVSDFDGIWTNQEIEAEFVYKWYLKRLSALSGKSVNFIESLFRQAKAEMNESPWIYGWKFNGGMSCIFGEDPYGDNNAVFDYFEQIIQSGRQDNFTENITAIQKAVLKSGFESLDIFGNVLFHESTTEFKERGFLNPCENAKKVIENLIALNCKIVVASNSKTNKIEYLFTKIGYPPSNEDSSERNFVHARGNSMKFGIEQNWEEVPEKFFINNTYSVDLRRPSYYKVLLEEKPDFVIGDVFSLDIALPLYLRLSNSNFQNLRVIQKIQKHTPTWVKDFLRRDELANITFMINDLEELPAIIERI
jgi:hypothetical protein